MELPVLNGLIDRRILVNYRVEPDVVRSLLPSYLEPLVINGYASVIRMAIESFLLVVNSLKIAQVF